MTAAPGYDTTGYDTTGFDAALAGVPARLLRSDGREDELAVGRWLAPAGEGDAWLLDRCTGPAIDLGCGPGRLVAALLARGVPAVGVDASPQAQRLCRRRGAPMVLRDVFAPLPPWWAHVLLADGNIGIGGDPSRLLGRAAELLAPGGTVLVEIDPDPTLLWRGTVRVRTADGEGAEVPWACVGADAAAEAAWTAGLRVSAALAGARSFVELSRGCRPGPRRGGSVDVRTGWRAAG